MIPCNALQTMPSFISPVFYYANVQARVENNFPQISFSIIDQGQEITDFLKFGK
jgi:hypothetical protein